MTRTREENAADLTRGSDMTPLDLINEALENSEGFTVNIWLRGGGELRNVNLITPPGGYKHPRDTHMSGGFQETGNPISIAFCEVAALEIEE